MSHCKILLLHEGCVSCQRTAGMTDLLISLYHQSLGSPSALGIWLTVNKSSRLAIIVSHSDLAAAQSWTLVFVSFSFPSFLFFFPKTSFVSNLSLYTFYLSLTPGIYHVIIFQSHLASHLEI